MKIIEIYPNNLLITLDLSGIFVFLSKTYLKNIYYLIFTFRDLLIILHSLFIFKQDNLLIKLNLE
jgi:hypothetical protein